MKKDEGVKEMYNRMKKITNQIKSLGGDKWGDREIVDKLLTVYIEPKEDSNTSPPKMYLEELRLTMIN